MFYSFLQFTLPNIFARSVLMSSRASLAHSLPLGILGPFHSFEHTLPVSFIGASLAHLILTFSWVFAKSFRFPQSNYHILYFWGLLAFEPISFTNFFLWAPLAYLCLLSTSYDSHELITSFFGAPLGSFAFFWAFLLFCRPIDHYSYHSGLIVSSLILLILILLILLSLPIFILLGFFLSLGFFFLPKWASTTFILQLIKKKKNHS